MFLEISQNLQENTCARVPFLVKFNFIKKETLVQVFSSEFCEISKNTFFTEHLWATASESWKFRRWKWENLDHLTKLLTEENI